MFSIALGKIPFASENFVKKIKARLNTLHFSKLGEIVRIVFSLAILPKYKK